MQVRVTKASDTLYWYAHHIGCLFNVKFLDAKAGEYIVRAPDGYINIIKEHDCEAVKEYDY